MSVPADLGPYRVVRELGAGAMGTVFEAVDTALHRRVALKVIAGALADDPGFRARFVREAQAQASLDSPHVVQVFAQGQDHGRLYIASQLIPDGDLGDLLRRHGPLPTAAGVELIAQVADGLAEAHRVGLVHRDIKPANVLLRKRGPDTVAYLADFGIASTIGAHRSARDSVAGTPNYMAPELHAGGVAGPMSDVYALGCLLWATLTGRAPAVCAPVPQLAARSRVEREVNRVLRSTLAPDPGDRPVSAAALRDDLRSLAGTPPGGRRVPAAVVAATLAGAVAIAVLITRTDAPSDTAREQAAIASIATVLEDQGDLDAREADCTARRLLAEHGVTGLQDEDILDEDLMLVEDGLTDVFSAAVACLWAQPSASRTSPISVATYSAPSGPR